MNFSENWYTSSHWHKNNTGKVSWTSEVWFTRYEKVLNPQTNEQTNKQTTYHVHLIVTDENFSSGTKNKCLQNDAEMRTWSNGMIYVLPKMNVDILTHPPGAERGRRTCILQCSMTASTSMTASVLQMLLVEHHISSSGSVEDCTTSKGKNMDIKYKVQHYYHIV